MSIHGFLNHTLVTEKNGDGGGGRGSSPYAPKRPVGGTGRVGHSIPDHTNHLLEEFPMRLEWAGDGQTETSV